MSCFKMFDIDIVVTVRLISFLMCMPNFNFIEIEVINYYSGIYFPNRKECMCIIQI